MEYFEEKNDVMYRRNSIYANECHHIENVMEYRYLGGTGLKVSCLGLGTWATFGAQITNEEAEEIVCFAYENGINVFDTAEVYAAGRAEIVLGSILKKKAWKRSSYIVMTKIYWGGKSETEKGLSRKHIIEGLKRCLQRLQLDYVDIVFANKSDPNTPMEEIVRAFTQCINDGMTLYWGTSRWKGAEIMDAYCIARQFNLVPPVCEQLEYHFFQREKLEVELPYLRNKIGLGTITWSPLACGFLTGKYERNVLPDSRASLRGFSWLLDKIQTPDGRIQQQKLNELKTIAHKLGCTLTQLAIAWCLKQEKLDCVLLGVSKVEQLKENIQAITLLPTLSSNRTLCQVIEKILDNKPIPKPSKLDAKRP